MYVRPMYHKEQILTTTSTSSRWMFLNLTINTGHLSHIPLLHTIQPRLCSVTSIAGNSLRNQEHCGLSSARSARRLLRHLHHT